MSASKKLLWLLGALAMPVMSAHAADSVGWNYDGGGDDTLAPGDLAGVPPYSQKNWNNHAGVGQAPGAVPFDLKDSNGAPSGVQVTSWIQSSNNSFQLDYKDPNPNEKLMNSFVDQNASITFSGIPAAYRKGRYSVVVYYADNQNFGTSVLSITGAENDEARRPFRTGNTEMAGYKAVGFIEGTDTNKDTPTNYTVFKGLNDSGFTVSVESTGNNGICAVQIVAENGPPIPESKTPAAAVSPADGSSGFKPWQPWTWKPGGEGEVSYDVYVWLDGAKAPATPTATVKKPAFVPPAYLAENKTYHWRLITHLESGGRLISKEFKFTSGTLQGQPPFDISTAGQAARTAAIEKQKGLHLLLEKQNRAYPLPNNTTLAFYGDSITDVMTYFDGIENGLKKAKAADPSFPDVKVLNRGINGGTSSDLETGNRRFNAGGGPAKPLPFNDSVDADIAAMPSGGSYIAVIQIGINDVLQGGKTPKAEYKERLLKMVDHVLGKKQRVVLVSPTVMYESPIADVVNDGLFEDENNTLINSYVEALQEIGRERNVPFVNQRQVYLDVYKNKNVVLANDGSVTYPQTAGILNGDVVHPNAKGKELSSELAARGIYEAVAKNAGK